MIFYAAAAFFAFYYLIFHILLNYNKVWQHVEVIAFSRKALCYGTDFHWLDFFRSFEIQSFDYRFRARFVNYFLWVLESKIRFKIFDFIPYHPTLTPTLIITVVLSPVLLFKWIKNETEDTSAAFAAVAFYLVSNGFLSGIQMYFHQGKPLTNLSMIAVFYFLSDIKKNFYIAGCITAKIKIQLRFVAVLLFVMPFLDETAFFVFPAVVVLFYREIFKTTLNKNLVVYLISSFSFFVLFVTFIAKKFVNFIEIHWDYNWWRNAIGNNAGLSKIGIEDLNFNFNSFTASHFLNFSELDLFDIRTTMLGLFVLFTLLIITLMNEKKNRIMNFKIVGVYFVLIVFQTIILSKRYPDRPTGSYYWGALASIPLSVFSGLAMVGSKNILKKIISPILFIILIYIFHNNSKNINNQYHMGILSINEWQDEIDRLKLKEEGEVKYETIRMLWEKRANKTEFEHAVEGQPKNIVWLANEASNYRTFSKISCHYKKDLQKFE